MISKNDCLILLTDLENKGLETQSQIKTLLSNNSVTLDVLKFINDNRQLDLTKFYEKLRKSYNNHKSNLYINCIKVLRCIKADLKALESIK